MAFRIQEDTEANQNWFKEHLVITGFGVILVASIIVSTIVSLQERDLRNWATNKGKYRRYK